MHVFLTLAYATDKNENYPEGECHVVMVFVNEFDRSSAEEVAQASFTEHGWTDVVIDRWQEIPNHTAPEDETLQAAFRSVLEDGCSLVAYNDPLEDGAV